MQIFLILFTILFFFGTVVAQIDSAMFRHRFITREMPGNIGMGSPGLADFDGDGDLDFAFLNRGDTKLYWFEYQSADTWQRHELGQTKIGQLGSATLDVDQDGRIDLVIGGFWFRNPLKPRSSTFQMFTYDDSIQREIHDIVIADINGDERQDIVAMGDGDGCFWYRIPAHPAEDDSWPRYLISRDVLDTELDIHAGLASAGVGDLNGDGDPDVMLTDRWMENRQQGFSWVMHRLLYGKKGPWGLSSRSWITDVDRDGDNDAVVVDCDGQNSATAWIENRDGAMKRHWVHYFSNLAPGTRGSFHSLRLADFDGDGDEDILVVEQEDPKILPQGAAPRWYIWENLGNTRFVERVILDIGLGGHDALA